MKREDADADNADRDDLLVLERYRALVPPVEPSRAADSKVLAAARGALQPATTARPAASARSRWLAGAGLALAASLAGVTVWLQGPSPTSPPADDAYEEDAVALPRAQATPPSDVADRNAVPAASVETLPLDLAVPAPAPVEPPPVLAEAANAVPAVVAAEQQPPTVAEQVAVDATSGAAMDAAVGSATAPAPVAPSQPAPPDREAAELRRERAAAGDLRDSARTAPTTTTTAAATPVDAAQQAAITRLRALLANNDPALDRALLDYARRYPDRPVDQLDAALAARLQQLRSRQDLTLPPSR